MMANTSCDLELAILAGAAKEVYTDGIISDDEIENQNKIGKNIGAGYKLRDFGDNFDSGFKYAVYQNGNDIILSFAGTDMGSSKDFLNDIMMGIKLLPRQLEDAKNIYAELKRNNPNANITITGHSLGGSLAQMVGAISGTKTITFDPYGTKKLLGHLKAFGVDPNGAFDNITNYKASNDAIYYCIENENAKNNIGTTYIIPNFGNNIITAHLEFNIFACGEKIPANAWEESLKIQNLKSYEYFKQAEAAKPIVIDPILLDLNDDGIKTTTIKDGKHFDHQADGFAETSAWVDDNDGILVIDRNNNGIIDNGSEIFGDNYVKSNGQKAISGFDALRDLDSNDDGVISAEDEAFSQIKILKGNGELISLEEAGITSINLNSTTKNTVDENGNTLISSGTFVREDGSVGSLGDFNLVVDKMDSFATEWLEESEEIAALPDVRGFGYVHSLHQAMVRDESGELRGLVNDFIDAEGGVLKREVLEQILYKWSGADNVVEGSRGSNFSAKKLYVLEKFIGKGFVGIDGSKNPNNQASILLGNAFNSLMNNVYASLMSQTELKDIFDMVEIVYDFENEKVSYDLDKVREYIDNLIIGDEVKGKNLLSEFSQSFVDLGLKDNSNYEEYYEYFVSKGNDYRYLLETINKNIIQGTDEADTIEGTGGADAVFGGGGDDVISNNIYYLYSYLNLNNKCCLDCMYNCYLNVG